jgi:hypothetical protein
MPAQCEPCPEYTNTVPEPHWPSCGPTTPTPSAVRCSAIAQAGDRLVATAGAHGGEPTVHGPVVIQGVRNVGQPHTLAVTLEPVRQRGGGGGDALGRAPVSTRVLTAGSELRSAV